MGVRKLTLKAVLFDLGGTLIDDSVIWKNVDMDYTIPFWKSHGIDDIDKIYTARKVAQKKFDAIESQNTFDNSTWTSMFMCELGIEPKEEIIKEESYKFMDYFLKKIKLMPYAMEILKFIKSMDLKIILVTNGWKDSTYKVLSKLEIRNFFDLIVISEEIGHIKSEITPFEIVIEKTGLKPEECLMVGDRLDEDAYSKKIGIKFVLFGNGDKKNYTREIEGFDFKIRGLDELKNIIDKLS